EIELVDGDERQLKAIRDALLKAGARTGSGQPKLFRVLGFEGWRPPRRADPGIEHLRAAIARQVGQLLSHDPALRLGEDAEQLHDFLVATRRLRAILRVGRRALGSERVEPLRTELAWLGSALGPARDADVMLEYLGAEIDALADFERDAARTLAEALAGDRPKARAAVVRALNSRRYVSLLAALDNLAHEAEPAREVVSIVELARRELRQLTKAIEGLGPNPPDETLHAARISAKRARYAAELGVAVAGPPVERLVAAVKDLQDVIGSHQDAAV